MPQKAHIVSFEQAKKASVSSRPSVSLSRKQTQRSASTQRPSAQTHRRNTRDARTTRTQRSQAVTAPRPSRNVSAKSARNDSAAARSSATLDSRRRRPAGVQPKSRPSIQERRPERTPQNVTRSRNSQDEPSKDKTKRGLRENLKKRKHDARKTRADKQFDKTVRTDEPARSSQATGSRAALYEGQMGASHKRAARMQNVARGAAGAASSTGHALRDAGLSWRNSPRFVATMGLLACLLFACVFLYPAARDYYVATRNHEQLQAEYAVVQERNNALQKQVDFMSTSEGVEAKAREDYGWVQPDEIAVSVSGINPTKDEVDVYASVPEGSVPAPKSLFSDILDPLFGYTG